MGATSRSRFRKEYPHVLVEAPAEPLDDDEGGIGSPRSELRDDLAEGPPQNDLTLNGGSSQSLSAAAAPAEPENDAAVYGTAAASAAAAAAGEPVSGLDAVDAADAVLIIGSATGDGLQRIPIGGV